MGDCLVMMNPVNFETTLKVLPHSLYRAVILMIWAHTPSPEEVLTSIRRYTFGITTCLRAPGEC